ncbi:MAG: DUF177 domain-containing protein [Pseudomonadota bacterium]
MVDPKRKSSSSLLLRLDEIPQAGRTLDVRLLPEEVRASLPDAYEIDGSRGGEVRGHVLLVDENLHVSVTVTVTAVFDCSRCAEPSRGQWTARIEALFVPKGRRSTKLGGDELDDEPFDDLVEYEGRVVDLRPNLGQALAVALDPYPVCHEDCAGLCSECGANQNVNKCTCTRPIDPRWGPLADILGTIQVEQEGDGNGSSQEA